MSEDTVAVGIKLPAELWVRVMGAAEADGILVGEWIERALEEYWRGQA